MSKIIVDVESDGPIPAEYSMVCFGAALFDEKRGRLQHAAKGMNGYGLSDPNSVEQGFRRLAAGALQFEIVPRNRQGPQGGELWIKGRHCGCPLLNQ